MTTQQLNSQFRNIKDLSPDEVFSLWEGGEGQLESWQSVAQEKGWESWHDWRWFCFQSIKGDEREWKLYEINDPDSVVPQFKLGPTQSWQKHFAEKNVHTFQDLIDQQQEWVEENDGVQKYIHDFPQKSLMMALAFPHQDHLTLFEGHHRCAAITLSQKLGQPIRFGQPLQIAVAFMKDGDEKYLEAFLERGTIRIPD